MSKIVIDAKKSRYDLELGDLWRYRNLFILLAHRDIQARYAQTFLGAGWVFLQPLMQLIIFTFIFSRVAKVDTGDVPYPVFAMAGMAAWSYFAFVSVQSGASLITFANMIKKIYFPRLIAPLYKAYAGIIDFGVNLILLIIVMLIYGYMPSINFWTLPLFIVLAIFTGLAVGVWVASFTIRYRDFQTFVGFAVQLAMYVTPIFYPASSVPGKYAWLFYLNPMTLVVQGFRFAMLGGPFPPVQYWYVVPFIFIMFYFGLLRFKKVEKTMADLL